MIGIILGSGLSEVASKIEVDRTLALDKIMGSELKGKTPPLGHKRQLLFGRFCGVPTVALQGRLHYYEGFPMEVMVEPVRYLKTMGVDTLIISFAGGAVNAKFKPGDLAVLSDHIHMQSANPLRGTTQFIDLTNLYDAQCRNQLLKIARKLKIRASSAVYASLDGPSYETPAEVRSLKIMGADVAGMSVTAEAITARSLGMRVIGLGWVSNMGAGVVNADALSHQEVLDLGKRVSGPYAKLLMKFIPTLK